MRKKGLQEKSSHLLELAALGQVPERGLGVEQGDAVRLQDAH